VSVRCVDSTASHNETGISCGSVRLWWSLFLLDHLVTFYDIFYDSISTLSSPFNIDNETEADGWPYLRVTAQGQKARRRKVSKFGPFCSIFSVLMHVF